MNSDSWAYVSIGVFSCIVVVCIVIVCVFGPTPRCPQCPHCHPEIERQIEETQEDD